MVLQGFIAVARVLGAVEEGGASLLITETHAVRRVWLVCQDVVGGGAAAAQGCARVPVPHVGLAVGTLAGGRHAGFADGVGTAAQFDHPSGVALCGDGSIVVADEFNHAIRRLLPVGAARSRAQCEYEVSTIAGCGVSGNADGAAHSVASRLR